MSSTDELLKRPYSRVLVPDDEGVYSAQIAEFPGCFAEGDSPDEAYRNLEVAAASWVEAALAQGLRIPEPNAWQAHSGNVSLRLPKSVHRRAAECAHSDGVSLNTFLVSAVAQRVGAEEALAATSLVDHRRD